MIDISIAFLVGVMFTWPAFIVLCVLGVIFESNNEHGLAVFVGIITAIVSYFFFALTLGAIALYVIAYFVTGITWSFWRYKRHCDMIVSQYKDRNQTSKNEAIGHMRPTRMLSEITAWVIVWPFSMFESVLGDVVQLVQTAITKFFKGIYARIFNNAVSQLTSNE